MKALTLWQPWASFIAVGAKRIETRSWPTAWRGPLAIHAARRAPDAELPTRLERIAVEKLGLGWRDRIPLGSIVAVCRVARVETTDAARLDYRTSSLELALGNYAPGRFAWVLEDVRALPEPVPAIGAQGLFLCKAPPGFEGLEEPSLFGDSNP
jgi:hypothetical protein